MGTDRKGQRYCDNCGRSFDKAVRVHLGAEYCRSCYTTQFVRAVCTRCGQTMRAHRHTATPVCAPCERAVRTCLRCGRLTPLASKLVDGRPVCPSCAVYFRPELSCEKCGRKSRDVFSSLIRQEISGADEGCEQEASKPLRLCRSCHNQNTHATCSVCRRYRPVAAHSLERKPLCRACAGDEPATHHCPGCGELTAGSGDGLCLPCSLKSSATRRAHVLGAGLERAWCREIWDAFATQLIGSSGHLHKASKVLTKSLPYFQAIERACEEQSNLSISALHAEIASPVHRKNLLAYRFILETLGSQGAKEARDHSNEIRRLNAILLRACGTTYAPLLEEFVAELRAKGTADRTVRLYAGVAQTFCERIGASSEAAWGPDAILAFLGHTPGAASSLSAFVGFCRRAKNWEVSMPRKQVRREQVGVGQHAVDRLHKALETTKGRRVEDLKLLEVVRVISAATGLSSRELVGAGIVNNDSAEDDITLSADTKVAPGHPLYPYARQWRLLLKSR